MPNLSKVSKLFPCSSKSFLNFRLSGARLLIKWFLVDKRISIVLPSQSAPDSYSMNYSACVLCSVAFFT